MRGSDTGPLRKICTRFGPTGTVSPASAATSPDHAPLAFTTHPASTSPDPERTVQLEEACRTSVTRASILNSTPRALAIAIHACVAR